MRIPKRFKNYGLWTALASLIGLILNDAGLVAPEQYQTYVDAAFAVLIAAGVIINPSNGEGLKPEARRKQAENPNGGE
ncbi:holin [Thalassobacillus sp. CUG 92003]|uniref:holin n=1 Tax=Thalassobacillus sp. CUG 92003 TaxID=2736641 RepID=UPI001C62AA01|nr:holin [Thalassobacillus sp. CUG 92003]